MGDEYEAPAGRTLELAREPEVEMELLVEKLKLLNYERDFLASKRPPWPPLTRAYFAAPASNGGEQFHYFTSLAAYLLQLAGRKFQAPAQFDDPNAACSNIFAELKKCDFETPAFAPGKLKQAHGREVISVLVSLCDLVVERNYARWARPKYLPDRYPEEPDVDEAAFAEAGGEGARGGSDGEPATDDDDDEEELAYVAGSGGSALAGGPSTPGADAAKTAEEMEETRAIESAVDAAEWKLELERVAPQLRVAAAADAKDWRSHLESAHKHQRQIARSFPGVKASLERVAADVASALDKIETRERFVNDQMEPLTAEYRRERERLDDAQARYDASSETVSDLTNELARVSERLEEVKATMANRGDDIADSTPLNTLKGSIEKLNGEVKLMEARIGIVRGTLLQLSLKKKDRAARGGGKKNVGAAA